MKATFRAAAVTFGAALVLPTALLGSAQAAAPVPTVSLLDSGGGPAQPFVITAAVPGESFAKTYLLHNERSSAVTVALSVPSVVDRENGCNGPESRVDHTCGTGADQGELSKTLTVALTSSAGQCTAPPSRLVLSPRRVSEMRAPISTGLVLVAHSWTCVRAVVDFPFQSGNETQTDQLTFSLRTSFADQDPSSGDGTQGGEGDGDGSNHGGPGGGGTTGDGTQGGEGDGDGSNHGGPGGGPGGGTQQPGGGTQQPGGGTQTGDGTQSGGDILTGGGSEIAGGGGQQPPSSASGSRNGTSRISRGGGSRSTALPFTGSSTMELTALALLSLGTGSALLLAARRRSTSRR